MNLTPALAFTDYRKMLYYWSNIFGMLGVALIATAFFRSEDWFLGAIFGTVFVFIGALFSSLSLKRGKK